MNASLRRVPIWLAYLLGAVPALWLIFQTFTGGLGPDPVKPLEHGLGLHAVQFLLASLTVTPLLRMSGVNLMRFRRALGLMSFFYATLHIAVWILLDIQLRWAEIAKDLTSRPYIIVGFVALIFLLPLAWTSRDAALRRLGPRRWRRLHLLAFPAAILAGLHFTLVQKTWQVEPVIYLSIALLLALARLARGPL